MLDSSEDVFTFSLVPISDVAASYPGAIKIGPFGSQLKKEDLSREGYKVYGQENIIANDFSVGSRRITATKFHSLSSCRLFPGDLVITMMGTIGKCAIFPEDAEVGIMDSHLLRIQVNQEIVDIQFVAMVTAAEEIVGWQIGRLSHGSIMSGLSSAIVRRLHIPLPSIFEQRRIATILDTLDTQIQKTEQLIAKLKQQREGLLHNLLTCGLDEDGELRDPDAHPELFKDSVLGRIPKDWEVSDLSILCHKVTDGCHQSVNTSSDDGIPFLFVSCIRNGQILWDQSARISIDTYNEISRGREPKAGLVLYTVVGSYGHAAFLEDDRPFTFQRHIAYILPDVTKLIPAFLVSWLNSSQGRFFADKLALGNAQKTITLGDLSRFPVPLLNIEEQKNITNILETLDINIHTESSHLAKLKQYKQGLMHDLLTGRVRVGGGEEMGAE